MTLARSLRALRALLAGALVCTAASRAGDARAETAPVLDRLVAVVDETPIFLSDVKARARPHLARLTSTPASAQRIAEEAAILRQLIEQMIDEELVARDARKLGVEVEDDEIDAAVDFIAKRASLSRDEIMKEAERQGLTKDGYRAQLRQQIVEGKWLQTKQKSRPTKPGASEAEVAAALEHAKKKLVAELRERTYVEISL